MMCEGLCTLAALLLLHPKFRREMTYTAILAGGGQTYYHRHKVDIQPAWFEPVPKLKFLTPSATSQLDTSYLCSRLWQTSSILACEMPSHTQWAFFCLIDMELLHVSLQWGGDLKCPSSLAVKNDFFFMFPQFFVVSRCRMMYVPSFTPEGYFHIHCWKCWFSLCLLKIRF